MFVVYVRVVTINWQFKAKILGIERIRSIHECTRKSTHIYDYDMTPFKKKIMIMIQNI